MLVVDLSQQTAMVNAAVLVLAQVDLGKYQNVGLAFSESRNYRRVTPKGQKMATQAQVFNYFNNLGSKQHAIAFPVKKKATVELCTKLIICNRISLCLG